MDSAEPASSPILVTYPDDLPIATPPTGSALQQISKRLAGAPAQPLLVAAAGSAHASDVAAELRSIIEELYTVCEHNCRTIKLLDRCWDHPELGPTWVEEGRVLPRTLLAEYLAARIRGGQLPGHASPQLLARIALETVVTWAIHIKWDTAPEVFDPEQAKAAVVDFVVRGVLLDPSQDAFTPRPTTPKETMP